MWGTSIFLWLFLGKGVGASYRASALFISLRSTGISRKGRDFYENQSTLWKKITTFELNLSDIKGWLNIDLEPDESEEEFEKRAQEEVDKEYNRPEYNVIYRQERHKGFVISTKDEDGEETGDFEPSMSEVVVSLKMRLIEKAKKTMKLLRSSFIQFWNQI